ncbi:hypothetical protein CEXT_189781 [Caerostris extrusa]|uniref:Uncharacterized protein n=1 Tax=Caerostris extrusa TaxID=172846 RepID=A0AAV4W5Y9_CAEEX|nr:hypothetical protein CEXT_189781 [Caerostris extrusa]
MNLLQPDHTRFRPERRRKSLCEPHSSHSDGRQRNSLCDRHLPPSEHLFPRAGLIPIPWRTKKCWMDEKFKPALSIQLADSVYSQQDTNEGKDKPPLSSYFRIAWDQEISNDPFLGLLDSSNIFLEGERGKERAWIRVF